MTDKEAKALYNQKYRQKHREQYNAYQRAWRDKNKEKWEATVKRYWEKKALEGGTDAENNGYAQAE